MTYQSINGGEINGTEDGGDKGVGPARFGIPVAHFAQPAAGLAPARLGVPVGQNGEDVTAIVPGLAPVRFGAATASVGMPPPATAFGPTNGLAPVRFGAHSRAGNFGAGAPASIQATRIGAATAAFGQSAEGIAPARLGSPGPTETGAKFSGLASVRFGTSIAVLGFGVRGMPPPRVGIPAALLGGIAAQADGMSVARFGVPGPVGLAARARALRFVRFGRPSLDRGAIC